MKKFVHEMASAGIESEVIAEELGLKVSTIEKILQQAGEERRPRTVKEAVDHVLIDYVASKPADVRQMLPELLRERLGSPSAWENTESQAACHQPCMSQPQRRPLDDLQDLAGAFAVIRDIGEQMNPPRGPSLLESLVTALAPVIPSVIQAQQQAAAQQAAMMRQGVVITQPQDQIQRQAAALPVPPPPAQIEEGSAVPDDNMVIYGFDLREFIPLLDLTPELAADALWRRAQERLEQGDPKLADVIETLDQTGNLIIKMLLSANAAKYPTIIPRLLKDDWVFRAKEHLQGLLDVEEEHGDDDAESEGAGEHEVA